MRQKLAQYMDIVQSDPAVDVVTGNIGARSNQAAFNVTLKPLAERKVSADQVINRLRPRLARVPGATLFLQAVQDVQIGGRQGNAQFQYTLQGDNFKDLLDWAPRVLQSMKAIPGLLDVNTDLQNHGLASGLGDRSRYRQPPRHHARTPLTARCTTPLASGRSPRCTRPSTSTLW